MFDDNISIRTIALKRYTFARNRAIIVGMEKNLKLRLIICVCAFVAVFVALLTVASFYDLQISETLTKGSLAAGEYYSSNQFALFFEVLGDSVVYLLGGIASLILVCAAIKMRDGEPFLFIKELKGALYKTVKTVLVIGFSAFAVYEFYEVFHDVVKYTDRYLYAALIGTEVEFSVESGYMIAIQLIFAVVTAGLIFALLIRVKREDIFKLAKLAVLMLIVEALYLVLVGAIKTPIGRMRYRAMNAIGDIDFSYYTPWYKINGARNVDINGIIVSGSAERDSALFGATDTCKSFPSGHTYCAATSFVLVCLPDLFERFKKTWIKVLCWTVPSVYTLTVAVCRIVVGAHFLSDVLVGGTLAFALIMIIREVLILKGAHFKAFKRKKEVETEKIEE